jgi:Spy/CpxP family protein refolding chaperone
MKRFCNICLNQKNLNFKEKIEMKKIFFISLLGIIISMISLPLHAQNRRQGGQAKEKIEAVKIGFFTQQMSLTPQEAEKFWPLYNQYQESLKKHKLERRKAIRLVNESLDLMNDDEINKLIDNQLEQAQTALQERQDFVNSIRKVLPARKVAAYFKAEELFRRKLMEKMKERGKPLPEGLENEI